MAHNALHGWYTVGRQRRLHKQLHARGAAVVYNAKRHHRVRVDRMYIAEALEIYRGYASRAQKSYDLRRLVRRMRYQTGSSTWAVIRMCEQQYEAWRATVDSPPTHLKEEHKAALASIRQASGVSLDDDLVYCDDMDEHDEEMIAAFVTKSRRS